MENKEKRKTQTIFAEFLKTKIHANVSFPIAFDRVLFHKLSF